MKRTGHWLGVLGLIALTAFAQSAWSATCTSIASGNWSDPTIWDCGYVPTPADVSVIAQPSTVIMDINPTVAGLVVNAGATVDVAGSNLFTTGNVVVNGTLGVSPGCCGGGGAITMQGVNTTLSGAGSIVDVTVEIDTGVIVPSGSTLNFSLGGQFDVGANVSPAASSLTINGTITGAGQQAGNSIILARAGATVTINGTVDAPLARAKIKAGGIIVNNGTVSVSYLLGDPAKGTQPSGVWTQGQNSTLTVTSTPAGKWQGTLNASATGNTVNYGGTSNPLTPSGNAYYHLTLSGSGIQTLPTGLTVAGNFTLSGTATTTAPAALTVGGNFIVGAGNTFSPGTGTATLNGASAQTIGGGTAALSLFNLTVNNPAGITLARNVIVSGALTGTVNLTSTCPTDYTLTSNNGATVQHSCPGGGTGATAGSFNAFESSTAANSTTGPLYTKLAGTALGFDVVAIQTSGTTLAGNFAGTVQLELVNATAATGAACTGAALIQTLGNVTFTAGGTGRVTAPAVTVAAAWTNVRVRMTYTGVTPSIVACSTDNFAIRPASFTLSTTAAITTPPASVIRVGGNFNLTATSNVSSGYTGVPAVVPAQVFVDGTTTPITATNWVGVFAAATGAAATGTFQYNELGTITLSADAVLDTTFTLLDQTSGGCVPNSTSNALSAGKYGCNIGSAAFGPLGRFIPDHFDTVVTQGCNTTGTAAQIFTYSGQPFTATITARGAATAAPANKQMTKYAGAYAKNTALTAVPAGGTLSPLQALSMDFVGGVATKTLVFTFATPPSVPAPITIRATDTDGVTSLGATEGVVNARAGRFRVSNALGADLYPLSVPWAVQYYNASGWTTNPDDTCTAAPATSAIGLSNYKGGLSSTSVTAVTLTPGNGAGVITLAKPNPKLTSSGSVWVRPPTSPIWLQPGVAGLANFSVFNGAREFIYMRETY